MTYIKNWKIIIWTALTVILLLSFWLGIAVSTYNQGTLAYLVLPLLIVSDFVLLHIFKLEDFSFSGVKRKILMKKILIWLMLSLNLVFAFSIGLTIPLLVSESRNNLGYIMIPLLIILNYIILDRYHYYQKHSKDRIDEKNE